ncbi:MAG: biotin synthase BioB [Bacteroidota bacterium]|nr:biotin synthase BioB [Bacteroidota bacterium]
MTTVRNDWQREEVTAIYNLPLLDLVYKAATIHREFQKADEVKVNTLISVKTGACPEDCAYCAQSSRYNTGIKPSILERDEILRLANEAKKNGASRVCLSASWKHVKDDSTLEKIISTGREIKEMGLNICCTLGSVNKDQVERLREAGFTAFNHNLDTSEEHYHNIITTRTYQDRLDTLNTLIDGGMSYCSGGILGIGESDEDRISMLHTLATMRKHPFSLPLNTLLPIKGTPLENMKNVEVFEMVRMIATARILMPETIICLAAGRTAMTEEGQAMCFMAGSNSIFLGEKLLTAPNPEVNEDMNLLKKLGLKSV